MKRIVTITISAFFFLAIPIVLVSALGNPIPATIPPWSHIQHALASHIPPHVWVHIVAYLLWIIYLWLVVGIVFSFTQHILRLRPVRVPFLGIPQDIAAQVIRLASAATLPPQAHTRESILRGAVPFPRNLTLVERSQLYEAERHAIRPERELLHQGKVSSAVLPRRYTSDPTAVWWLDTALRHLAKYYQEAGRCPPVIRRASISDAVSLRVDSTDKPPPPWTDVAGIDGFWTLRRSTMIARQIAASVDVDTIIGDRLIPIGEDETGAVVWTFDGNVDSAASTYDLAEIARWLAMVPWLASLYIVTCGDWAKNVLAPAHKHVATQRDLLSIINDVTKTIIVLSETPRMPTSRLERQNIIWIGQEWGVIANSECVTFTPNSARQSGLRLMINEREDGDAPS